ncbi:MAG: hypothetical protein LBI42_00220 [Chitinispirillales bacterium]|jgi:hypothetical protein|nr:hypothetical protein [Chitinispirillales bacterium]
MSIRWLRNVLIDGNKSTIEIQIGDRHIGDKCYTRINEEVEMWFENIYNTRSDIIAQGIDILKKRLSNRKVTFPDGHPYDWQ